MIDKPIPESYWVRPGYFLAGKYPVCNSPVQEIVRPCMARFLEAGFNTFLDLTQAGELSLYLPALQIEAARYGIAVDYQRFDFQDWGLPAHAQMVRLLDAIDSALAAGRKVYLHCWGGIGRTGMAVGCWLVRHGASGEQALIRLNELYNTSEQSRRFPKSPETQAQVKFILDWREDGLA
jgi:protein-tyrosine phosphatase